MMFWREKASSKEQNGGPPCGQVRVLVVGDSGVGKTSLVHLIMNNSAIARPSPTIGCTVSVKHISYVNPGSSSNNIKGDSERDFFVEIWDISGHERYKDCRSLFYKQINGVIFVHDLSQRKTKANLHKWASEIAACGAFSAPLAYGGFNGLPVPYLVVGNKADIAGKENTRGSSGNLVDVARQWVEKQGLLPPSEELPLTESFPGSSSHTSAAKEARFDKEGIMKFFRMLIRRRYFPDEVPVHSSWSASSSHTSINKLGEISSEDDLFQKSASLSNEAYKYNALPPLPAQNVLTPPTTHYPQQPMSVSDNYTYNRFSFSGMPDTPKAKRTDINV